MNRRQCSNQWNGAITAQATPKLFRVQKIALKIIASIFWYQDGILLFDYLRKGQINSTEYYVCLLVHLKDILKEKCCCNFIEEVLYLQGNAPADRPLETKKEMAYLGFQCLDHPPYSPDPTPSVYHLFPGLKIKQKFHHFSSDVEVIPAAEFWLDGQISEIFEWLA